MALRISGTAFILAAPLLLSGCLPIPHGELVAPAVSGILMQNGQPVGGAKIVVESHNKHRTVITTPKGTFSTQPIHKWFFLMRFMGESMYSYAVYITVNGKTYKAYWQNNFGFAPKKAKLYCSLPKPVFKGMYCKPTSENIQHDFRFLSAHPMQSSQ